VKRGAAAKLAGALLTLTLALSGCSAAADGRPTVVVTTNILGDITRNLVGDQANVVVLMESNADPHSFGISAKQAWKRASSTTWRPPRQKGSPHWRRWTPSSP
jgi:zinc/manganese transport system substrate-binding protein